MSQIKTAELGQKISLAVAKKLMDVSEQQNQAALDLLRSAAQVGQPASGPGVGRHLDVTG